MDININYEDCSYKSSANDYDFTSFLSDKLFRNASYLRRIAFEGHYDNYNLDSSELRAKSDIVTKRRGEQFTKNVTIEGKTEAKTFYRYLLMLPINHGLAHDNQVLPPGVHVRLSYHRASPKKALVNVTNKIVDFGKPSIDIIDPTFHFCWAYSPQLEQQMSKVAASGVDIPFDSSHIRHRVLDDGLQEHTVSISQGKIPKYMVFFLMSPDRFGGDYLLSSTKFEMCGLKEFAIALDNEILPNYPLKKHKIGNSCFHHEFYRHWLNMTERYGNSEDEVMEESVYVGNNFLIVETFEDSPNKDGHLTVKLAFDQALDEKLLLCWMPVTEKVLHFDRNLSVQLK